MRDQTGKSIPRYDPGIRRGSTPFPPPNPNPNPSGGGLRFRVRVFEGLRFRVLGLHAVFVFGVPRFRYNCTRTFQPQTHRDLQSRFGKEKSSKGLNVNK